MEYRVLLRLAESRAVWPLICKYDNDLQTCFANILALPFREVCKPLYRRATIPDFDWVSAAVRLGVLASSEVQPSCGIHVGNVICGELYIEFHARYGVDIAERNVLTSSRRNS